MAVFGIALVVFTSDGSFDAQVAGGRKVADVTVTCRSPLDAIRGGDYPTRFIMTGPELRRACDRAERVQGVEAFGLLVAAGVMVVVRSRLS
jgi:hypothetical protein